MTQRMTVLLKVATTVALGLSCAAFSACTIKTQANAGAQSSANAPAAAPVQPARIAAAPAATPVQPARVAAAPAVATPQQAGTSSAHAAPTTSAAPDNPNTAQQQPSPNNEAARGRPYGHAAPDNRPARTDWVDKEFTILDKNKDGAITQGEAGNRWDRLKAADANNDGKITREEFEEAHRDGKLNSAGQKVGHHPDDARDAVKEKK